MEAQTEITLWQEYRIRPSDILKHRILDSYLGLVWSSVYKYRYQGFSVGLEPDELFSEGYIGLEQAFQNFNPSLGIKFRTYARLLVWGRIAHSIRDYSKGTRLTWESRLPRIREIDYEACIDPHTDEYLKRGHNLRHLAFPDFSSALIDRLEVERLLDLLPEYSRSILQLVDLEERNLVEVAGLLGISPQAVGKARHKALKQASRL